MKAKISRSQYLFTIPNLLYGKAIGITSGVIVRKVGGDTWTTMLFGFVIGIGIILMLTYVNSKFPEKTIIQISEELMGKWPSKILGMLLVIFFAFAFSTSANVMTLHVKEYFLLETPFLIICVIYTVLCTYGVYLGIEVIVRFALIGFFMSLFINLTMVAGTIKDFRMINLRPLFDMGLYKNVSNSVYIFSDLSMAILAVGILYPMLNDKKKSISVTFWAMLIGVVLIVIWPMFETGVMGADTMKKYVIVCMQQVRCAQLTRYLPRYELIMVSFFTFGVYVQSAVMFYCSTYCFKQATGIKKDWYIFLPLTVILIFITYYTAYDHNKFINFLTFPWPQICAALSIGIPVVLFITAALKGRMKGKEDSAGAI